MIVGTAGHIDHGKTTLVRALTGVDTDRLPEEKRRGITIELGFAPLELPNVGTVGIVDVPGHEGFVRTMLAGATGVDVGLLVIAADEGVMPQTREHLAILSLLDVRALLVALTKCETVDAEWLALVRDDVASLLNETRFADVPIIETSAFTGAGISVLKEALQQTLGALPLRNREDLFRLPVDRAFTVRGTGTVATGTVWSGTATNDTALRLFPGDRPVRARALQAHGHTLSVISPGTRAAIALAGVELHDVSRGASIVEDSGWELSTVVLADVALLDSVDRPLRPREWVRLHLGTIDVGARIVAQGGAISPGERRGARIVLDAPIVGRALDRFVLRRTSPPETIGGGIVVDPVPPRRRAKPWPTGLSVEQRLERLVADAGVEGIPVRSISVRLGVPPSEVRVRTDDPHFTVIDARLYAASAIEKGIAAGVESVNQFHKTNPLEEGMPLSGLRAALGLPGTLAEEVVRRAEKRGAIEISTGLARRPGWKATLDASAVSTVSRLRSRLESAGAEPPSLTELRGEFGNNDVVPLLRILEREGVVVQVETDRFYAASSLTELLQRLRKGMEGGRVYTPSELRELLGISRKYLIPLLEYCDRHRITERRDQGRVLG